MKVIHKIKRLTNNTLLGLEHLSIQSPLNGEQLSINKKSSEVEALIDEGGYGFEPSLYIIGKSHERVCKIVENLGEYMEAMV